MSDLNTVTFDANQWQLVPKVPSSDMLDRAVAFALNVKLGGDYNWSAYMSDVWERMLSAAPTPAAQSADHFRQQANMVDHSGEATEKVSNHVADVRNMVAAQSAGQEAIYQARTGASEWADVSRLQFESIKLDKRIVYAAPVNGSVDDTYDQDGETLSLASLPPLRAELAGGTFRGVTTRKDGTHCAVILLPNKATEQRNWEGCVDWAREAGGELPTRSVFHLLRLSATKEELAEGRWYYTADLLSDDTGNADDAAYAWYCDLNYGFTNFLHKSYEGLAVAVRLIPLTSTAKEQK